MKSEYFKNQNNYIMAGEMSWCADYCRTHWEEEVRHILRIADDAVNHTYLFDLRWDMERTYEPVHFDGDVVWDYMPGDDQEFIFQFNRHQFFICLGQAYALTGNETYAETFAEQLVSWIRDNPLNDETKGKTWRSIEAGIRGETWVKAMGYFKDSPAITEEVLNLYTECLKTHAEYLMESYRYFQIKSNWGVIESRGLLEIALALSELEGMKEAKIWRETAISRLAEGIRVQVMDDGVQWEQSPMYHNEVLHCCIEALRLAKRYQFSMPEDFVNSVKKMAHVNLIWKKPNHCQVTQGDSDETDLRDMLAQCAYLFQDPVLKYGAYERLDYDGAWDYLREGCESYARLETVKPDFLLKDLDSSGNAYLRSDWSETANFLHFRCGSLGGGHGHSDKLHVDVVFAGEDVLMDSGRYHYVDGPLRSSLKSAASHNTPMIDGRDYLVCRDAWGVKDMAPAYPRICRQKGSYTLFQGGHGGYLKEGENGVYVNRKVLAIGTDLYLILDEFYGGAEHVFQQRYHFNPDGTAEMSPKADAVHYEGKHVEADLIFSVNNECEANLAEDQISRNYNQMEAAKSLTLSQKKKGCCTLAAVIAGGKKGEYVKPEVTAVPVSAPSAGLVFKEEEAQGFRIVWKGNTYVVIVSHKDIGSASELLAADGCMGLGTVLVFGPEEEKTGGCVLCW